jgi:hypothetical protein
MMMKMDYVWMIRRKKEGRKNSHATGGDINTNHHPDPQGEKNGDGGHFRCWRLTRHE